MARVEGSVIHAGEVFHNPAGIGYRAAMLCSLVEFLASMHRSGCQLGTMSDHLSWKSVLDSLHLHALIISQIIDLSQ
jgi:hypothetical protein